MIPTLWLKETTVVVYAFDVDETLEVSKGPVKLADLVTLREHGHIVGLCGNCDGDAALSGLAPHLLVRGAIRHREARLFASAAAVHFGA
jgi:hypothetical protein